MTTHGPSGKVCLVGAGPGDPALITVRARELLAAADVIVYDYLANARLLDTARPDAERVYVGKSAGRHAIPQDEIETILVDRARKGLSVVRLKGGDPFVFGRGGEEIAQLERDGVPFEIVPGVTAALASAAYAGIPLTHREYSSVVTFLTGHENPEKHTLSIDFRDYARLDGTLCIYMGIGQLPRIVNELREGGMSGDQPVGIVQWATLNRQRSLFGTLDTIVARLDHSGMGAPAVVFIGEVVARRSADNWFEGRPLFGRRMVVTRAREQAARLTELLEAKGAEVLELPFIKVSPDHEQSAVGEVMAGLATYEWIVFTSVNGVRCFFDLFDRAFDDIRCLGPMRVAAVGAATARAIRERNLKVDIAPEKANADALADAMLEAEGLDSVEVLVITGNRNRPTLVERLESEGRAIVDTLPLYKTEKTDLAADPAAERLREEGADAILFTSASTVQSYFDQRDRLTPRSGKTSPVFGVIGPKTREALEAHGHTAAFASPEPDLGTFVDAATDYFHQS